VQWHPVSGCGARGRRAVRRRVRPVAECARPRLGRGRWNRRAGDRHARPSGDRPDPVLGVGGPHACATGRGRGAERDAGRSGLSRCVRCGRMATMLRWLTAGESHGPELVAILEGLPAGVPILPEDIQADLKRRTLGYGRGARQAFEQDELHISGGIRFGATVGSPVALRIGNTEWPRWVDVMSATPVDPATLPKGRGAPLTRPRPGHADLVGMQKYGFEEARNVLERASARETAARVALGAVARKFLAELRIRLVSHTLSIGTVRVPEGSRLPTAADVTTLDANPLRCFDPATTTAMVAEVDKAHDDGDTLG